MSAHYISFNAPWPTYASGRAVYRGPEHEAAIEVIRARIAALTTDEIEQVSLADSDETLLDRGRDLDPSDVADKHVRERIEHLEEEGHVDDAQRLLAEAILRQNIYAAFDRLLDDDEIAPHFDGRRWWAEFGGWTNGDYPDGYSDISLVDHSGVGVAPVDADEFDDAEVVAAVTVILDSLADRTLAALAAAGITTQQQRAAAQAELAKARLEVIPTARLARKAMTAVRENNSFGA